jgi:hypothetical protein
MQRQIEAEVEQRALNSSDCPVSSVVARRQLVDVTGQDSLQYSVVDEAGIAQYRGAFSGSTAPRRREFVERP